jgi:hypothetical protein
MCSYTGRVLLAPLMERGQLRLQSKLHRLRPSRNSDEEEYLKKIGLLTLLIMATLLFTLAFTAAAAGPKAPAAPVPAAAAIPAAPAAAATPEEHPHIHEALEAMRNAKHHLETAEHDFHGHRVKAIEHLNQAIHEAEICEQER